MSLTQPTRPQFRCFLLTMAALAAVLCSGCLFSGRSEASREEARRAKDRARVAGAFQASLAGGARRVSIRELDQFTYGDADRCSQSPISPRWPLICLPA
jgi:hypothetical protein